MTVDRYEAALAVGGLAALIAAWVPGYTAKRPLSLPIILVAIGAGFFLVPLRSRHRIQASTSTSPSASPSWSSSWRSWVPV